jgi:hypothetical protein
MMEFFTKAWNDTTGLTPLQKLIWIRCCDCGMGQTCIQTIDEWLEWTGAEVHEFMDAVEGLCDRQYLVSWDTQETGELVLTTKFAAVYARPAPVQRDPNEYRKKPIPAGMRNAVFRRDRHECVYCGDREGPLTVDHVVPESRGGEATMNNLVCACKPCNSSKGTKSVAEWRGA